MEKLNTLEKAILNEIANTYPELSSHIESIRITKRELTGVGSYTNFAPIEEPIKVVDNLQILNLNKLINIPSIEHGLGAHIEMKNGIPEFLEIYTYGNSSWDGTYDQFNFTRV